jgi:hypothetical protein
MNRRRFLHVGAATALAGVAGCSTSDGDATGSETTAPNGGSATNATTADPNPDLPDGIYVQPFRETMAMQGTKQKDGYAVGLMYAVPHVFWNVTGSAVQETERSGDIHLMAIVWDPETNTVLPESGVSVEITRDGELVSQEVIYPMLSQRMGFHWGGNFSLEGDGEYVGKVSIGGVNVRRTGAFEGQFDDATTIEVPFAFNDREREKIRTAELDAYGEPGAVEPMNMGMMPQALAPTRDDLPGMVLVSTRRDDATFLSTHLTGEAASRFDTSDYLAVSARTRYNRIVLPSMQIEATVTRDGSTVFDGTLRRTLDPDLDYHYGAAIDDGLQGGDDVSLRVTTPPQVARHEGYETAFRQMSEPMTFTV